MKILGLDVGGAHIKSALLQSGSHIGLPERRITLFEIFKNRNGLPAILKKIIKQAKPDAVALTMTGELADVFPSRRAGVRFILRSTVEAAKPAMVKVVNAKGELVSISYAKKNTDSVASANWAATAKWVSKRIDNGIVLDIGSTTTDILPIRGGTVAVKGENDYERLESGELLYTGYLRTNAAAVSPVLEINGKSVGACPEHFAIMGDAFLYLGEITSREYTTPTPDGAPKTKMAAARRLARLVLSEPEKLGERNIKSMARQIVDAQIERIAAAVRKIAVSRGLDTAPLILIGHERIYRKRFEKKISNPLTKTIAAFPVGRIDPASCAADLMLETHVVKDGRSVKKFTTNSA